MPQPIAYQADGLEMIGQLFAPSGGGARAGVLVSHESPGLADHTRSIAARLADLGYAALAVDYQGGGQVIADREEMMRRFATYMADPSIIRRRMEAALAALRSSPGVEGRKIAAIGYCYGGTASLELARGGADIQAVVGFHCGLGTARPQDAANIKAPILVQIGADDPVVPPDQRQGFEQEMNAAKVDWRMSVFSGTSHSFTNPEAETWGMPGFAYNRLSDERAWRAMIDMFDETLGSS
ncbi:MAG TPA: dienelactone hydrolase family protein [Phenylobacterium sp.]